MSLPVPPIDDRTFQDLLDEAVARIRIHNPEWTNYNESDPGITLLQLFAFMTESLLYRSNLIPERSRLAFLNLAGVAIEPAHPAVGLVAFENPRGPLRAVILDRDLELLAGKIPFRSDNGLAVLPAEARAYLKSALPPDRADQMRQRYEQVYASYRTGDVSSLVLYETTPVEFRDNGRTVVDLAADSIDGTLWLALLARTADLVPATRDALGGQVLTLGIVPDRPATGRVLPPGGSPDRSGAQLAYAVPDASEPLPADPALRIARYRPLDARPSTDVLSEPGLVELSLPDAAGLALWSDLEPNEDGVGAFPPAVDGADGERIVTWIRIRPQQSAGSGEAGRPGVRVAWIGINAATVRQRARVTRELVGRGTGEPDQVYRLAATPVLTDSLRLTVAGQLWQPVDDLFAAGAEVPVGGVDNQLVGYGPAGTPVVNAYLADRETGEIRFGDGLHGARPAANAVIEADYDVGGGREGLVGPGAIVKGPDLPTGLKVANPVATWGGSAAPTVAEAERQVRSFLHHHDRAVCADDFRDIALSTAGVDVARAEVLPLFDPDVPDLLTPGAVTVLVIPRFDPAHPDAPAPDQFFIDLVCAYLDARRLITTEVHVIGPEYVPVHVAVGFDALPGRDLAVVRNRVQDEIRTFLSALTGGLQRTGWPLSTNVERLELWAVANRVDGVAKVNDVQLTGDDGRPVDRVELTGGQLPRLADVLAGPGDPPTGEVPPGPDSLPVPVDPGEC